LLLNLTNTTQVSRPTKNKCFLLYYVPYTDQTAFFILCVVFAVFINTYNIGNTISQMSIKRDMVKRRDFDKWKLFEMYVFTILKKNNNLFKPKFLKIMCHDIF